MRFVTTPILALLIAIGVAVPWGALSPASAQTPTATPPPVSTATATGVATATATLTATATATATPGGAPTVASVAPDATNPNAIVVSGVSFLPGATVTLDGRPLQTTVNSPSMATALLPPGLGPGPYGITVINPGFPPSPPFVAQLSQGVLATTLFVPAAVKRSPGDSTAVFVQNISPTFATVTVRFYDLSGFHDQSWMRTAPVPPGESAVFDLGAEPTLPPGFDGSIVFESSQPIAAVVNRLASPGMPGESPSAPGRSSAGSFTIAGGPPMTQATVPVVFGGYHGYHTTISVQNTGVAPGNYAIAFYPNGVPVPLTSISRAIPARAAARIRVGPESGLPPDFVGTAVVTSSSPLQVVAETIQVDSGVLLSYSGFSGGANVANAPLLFKNSNGWVSGAQIVNVSQAPVVVNASLIQRDAPLSLGLGARPLAPNESVTYYLPAINELPDGFVGSGVFTATGRIALVVQELNSERGTGMAYGGFSTGSRNVSVPVIFKGSAGWDSGIQVQNLGNADALVNATYHLPGGMTVNESALIAAGSSTTLYQQEHPGIPAGAIGAATLTSVGGQPIVAIVNEVNYERSGDSSMSYEGINY